ncbi:hypothetical protein [Amycolatopsis pretoriensis]|uniref:hypothetical protein n=1 Tax=Amycolatopsis pretoriensis TaxID=218821 RepID=UPI00115F9399|nr:hypothetical protein [Amycolatopsis pretoriensis]
MAAARVGVTERGKLKQGTRESAGLLSVESAGAARRDDDDDPASVVVLHSRVPGAPSGVGAGDFSEAGRSAGIAGGGVIHGSALS